MPDRPFVAARAGVKLFRAPQRKHRTGICGANTALLAARPLVSDATALTVANVYRKEIHATRAETRAAQ